MKSERILHHLLVLVILAGAFSCSGDGGGGTTDPGPQTYSISGRVVDINGNGVPGASVALDAPGQQYTLTTDGSGNYSIAFQTAATFTVRASMSGYTITPASHTVTADTEVTGINFDLESAIIRFSPPTLTIPGVGQEGVLVVAVDGVTDLFAASFTIQYDPSVLEVLEDGITISAAGYFFLENGADIIISPRTEIDADAGTLILELGATGAGFTGASGSGIIAGITFRGKQSGFSEISFKADGADDLILSRYPQNGTPEQEMAIAYTATVTVNP